MVNLLFGASGSLGTSIIKIILKKYKKKKFLYISRTKPFGPKNRWIKCDLNKDVTKFNYKKIKYCIFLASPQYLRKNMNLKTFSKEYDWVKKITSSFDIDRLIYVSSPAVYLNNHYVGINKIRIERFLLKNKIKFKSLQIWRPYNLINISYRKYSDHFHSLLFKIMFVQKKATYKFNGNKNDTRGYADINEFSNVLLKNAFLKKSFTKNFGNLDKITVDEIIKIYNKYFHLKFKKKFIPVFMSKKINRNIISNNSNNNVYVKQSSKNIIKKYLLAKLNEKNK
tara:strand:+ start:2688 stop:3533 length:846 start_codon:yes stop_codon:yes gene_type:complete